MKLRNLKYRILKTVGHKLIELSVKKLMSEKGSKTISTMSTFKDGISVVAHVTTEDPLSLFSVGNTHSRESSGTTYKPRDKDRP